MSSRVVLKDRSGKGMEVLSVDGYYFHSGATPIPYRQHLDRVKQMNMRPDDILLCSYPKAGSHWLWEILSMIIHGDLKYRGVTETTGHLDFRSMDYIDSLPSRRLLNTHCQFQFLPKQVLDKKTKVVFLDRNPKAIAVSFYNMMLSMTAVECYDGFVKIKEYDGSWDDFFEMFLDGQVLYGSWFDYIQSWTEARLSHPSLNILDIRFEDMKKDAVAGIEKIAEFLEVTITSERAEAIATACSLSNMKKAYDKKEHKGTQFKADSGMIKTGTSDGWKNWFNVHQNERFNQLFKERMGTKFTL